MEELLICYDEDAVLLNCLRCGHYWNPRVANPVVCPRCHSPFWNRPRRSAAPAGSLNQVGDLAPYVRAFALMNRLQRERVVRRWVLYGSTAFVYYDQPIVTRDVDILVLVESRRRVNSALRQAGGHPVGEYTFDLGDGVAVQIFVETTADEEIEELFAKSRRDTVAGEAVYVMSPEHLILAALTRFDPIKDFPRIQRLVAHANKRNLSRLLNRYGDLKERFQSLDL